MSYIGGPLPGQEKEEESKNRDLIQSYKDRTIGKETIDRTISVVQKLQKNSPEWLKQGASTTGNLLKDTYMDARTLEGKEWLNPADVALAGAVRAVEGVGKLTQPIATFGENFSHKVLGIDVRGAKVLGIATEIAVTGGVGGAGVKATKYVKSGAAMNDLTVFAFKNAPEGSVARLVADTGGGIAPVTLKSKAYKDWTRGGQEWLNEAKRQGKKNPMTGYKNFVDPETGITYRKGYTTSKDTMGNIDLDGRKIRDAKRLQTTRIPEEEVKKIMKNYNQPPEMVEMFMDYQKAGKKNIDSTIARINKRIIEARKKDPNAFPGVKASLGHGRAASRYEHSADIVSNIDLENFFINVQRSNLDEVSDTFNRALGRSLDLDEEILKFIDKDIGKFHKGFTPTGGPLTRKQKDIVIDYVKKRIDKNIDWKSPTAPTGEQLFKSKEEYLINEALEFVTTKKKSN
jgi:hypothetical protein